MLSGVATSRASGTRLAMTEQRASLNAPHPPRCHCEEDSAGIRRGNPLTIGHSHGEGSSPRTVLRRDEGHSSGPRQSRHSVTKTLVSWGFELYRLEQKTKVLPSGAHMGKPSKPFA